MAKKRKDGLTPVQAQRLVEILASGGRVKLTLPNPFEAYRSLNAKGFLDATGDDAGTYIVYTLTTKGQQKAQYVKERQR